jgi:hypothetical protein
MTARKADIVLSPRLTAYVTREEGAAELRISPSTWDELVETGQIPKPVRLGRLGTILRWRWADVMESEPYAVAAGFRAAPRTPEGFCDEQSSDGVTYRAISHASVPGC